MFQLLGAGHKSIRKEQIIENSGILDSSISNEEMETLNGLNENLITGWDPTVAP
ncbi:MAG: hypothetical protein IH880_08135 [Candidatus Marinimicrobia bacterium]|nr:hypothetical protein [Candidatus Neomarinimicrobiota bacterium]